jgi:hypothetical protein
MATGWNVSRATLHFGAALPPGLPLAGYDKVFKFVRCRSNSKMSFALTSCHREMSRLVKVVRELKRGTVSPFSCWPPICNFFSRVQLCRIVSTTASVNWVQNESSNDSRLVASRRNSVIEVSVTVSDTQRLNSMSRGGQCGTSFKTKASSTPAREPRSKDMT